MTRGDLHIHSKFSPDSSLEPETIIKVARARKLETIAVTDHNTIKGGVETKRQNESPLKIIVGAEINTDKGEITGLYLTVLLHFF